MNALSIQAESPAVASRTFVVLLGNRARVDAALVQLAKRATRKGLTPVAWTWGKPVTTEETIPHPDYGWKVECRGKVSRIPVTIEGDSPKYAGWRFLAALQHLDGDNIIRAIPGESVPEVYRTRGPTCDHCKAIRRRNDTYVLRHDDNRVLQVGSTCIGDFLGSDDAGKLAASASMLAEACGLAESGLEGFGACSGDVTLSSYLEFVAWEVRVNGWISRTAAREKVDTTASADSAWTYLVDRKAREKANADPTADDTALAESAEAWAENLSDETVNAESGDYLHNVRALARNGIVTFRTAGIGASIVTAYQRAIGRERAKAERLANTVDAHVGTVGKRETFIVVLDFVTGYETQYGYTTILKFRDASGACLVWKASNTEIERSDVGKRYSLTGTVKEHGDYKGAKQTMVTRCKLSEIKA